jgi:pheromone shutdown protein TraB
MKDAKPLTKEEKVRMDREFQITLDEFLRFLKGQDKIKMVSDLVMGLLYDYVSSHNGVDTTRCLLRPGPYPENGVDAVINVELQKSAPDVTYVAIFNHTTGLPLTMAWSREKW